jgi:hypothetical protein
MILTIIPIVVVCILHAVISLQFPPEDRMRLVASALGLVVFGTLLGVVGIHLGISGKMEHELLANILTLCPWAFSLVSFVPYFFKRRKL